MSTRARWRLAVEGGGPVTRWYRFVVAGHVRLSRKLFSPRFVVLRVDSAVWQRTVNGVASVDDVPLIDVSDPSGNVIWGIEQPRARFGPRCVFVGEYPRVAHLAASAPARSTSPWIERLLDGSTVLACTTDKAGSERYTVSLRPMIDRSVHLPKTGPHRLHAAPRQLVVQARADALRARRRARLLVATPRITRSPAVRPSGSRKPCSDASGRVRDPRSCRCALWCCSGWRCTQHVRPVPTGARSGGSWQRPWSHGSMIAFNGRNGEPVIGWHPHVRERRSDRAWSAAMSRARLCVATDPSGCFRSRRGLPGRA
jgi:hypothetical protein